MGHSDIIGRIEENPILAAVREENDVEEAANSPVSTVFLLRGDIFNIKAMV